VLLALAVRFPCRGGRAPVRLIDNRVLLQQPTQEERA
jgi:hypothetical protein